MIKLPEKYFLKRMSAYLSEMYPVPARIFSAFMLASSFIFMLCKIHNSDFSLYSFENIYAVFSIFMFMLILRLLDELKDLDIDNLLFRNRPLPSGRVQINDINFSLILSICIVIIIHSIGLSIFLSSLIVISYMLLMFKYFFIPDILKKQLLLNLATHNPVIPLIFMHVLIVFMYFKAIDINQLKSAHSLLLVFVYWSFLFSWEVSRKIRSLEEENDYVTYSQIFGRTTAVFITFAAQILGLIFFYTMIISNNISIYCVILHSTGLFVLIYAYLRFLLKPNARTSKLKPFVEGFILLFCAGILTDYLDMLF